MALAFRQCLRVACVVTGCSSPREVTGYDCTRLALGLLLLAAAALKGHQLASQPLPETGLLTSRWFLIGVVEFELALGLLLLSGLYPKWTWRAALACFSGFACVTLYKALSGESSCGCFGRLSEGVKPIYTLLFVDVPALAALAAFRPRRGSVVYPPRFVLRCCGVVAIFLSVGILAAVAGATYRPARLADSGDVIGSSRFVILEPDTWIGKPFPLLAHLRGESRLSEGSWLVLLYHRGCPGCEGIIPRLESMARSGKGDPAARRVALVEVPSNESGGRTFSLASTDCVLEHLDEANEWVVTTPVEIDIDRGTVVGVRGKQTTGNARIVSLNSSGETALADPGPVGDSPAKVSAGVRRSFPDYRAIRRTRFLQSVACGPLALIEVLKTVSISLDERDEACLVSAAGSKGTTLRDLDELASRFGAHSLGVQVSTERLRDLGIPAVVHLNGGTFAAALAYEDDGVRVVYPLEAPVLVPYDRFRRLFEPSGRALLVSQNAISARGLGLSESAKPHADGPILQFSRSAMSVGRIYDHTWAARVEVRNDGTQPLRLEKVKVSCSCISARIDREMVPPGEVARLDVTGRQDQPGSFSREVVLATNERGREVTSIRVNGCLESPVFLDPPCIRFEGVSLGQRVSQTVPFDLAQGFDIENTYARVSKGPPELFDFKIRTTSDGGHFLEVQCTGRGEPGWHQCTIELGDGKRRECCTASLHAIVEVLPSIETFPPMLLIPDSELGATWQRKLTVQLHTPVVGDVSLRWSLPEFQRSIRVETKRVNDRVMAVTLSPQDAASSRSLRGMQADLIVACAGGHDAANVPLFVGTNAFSRTAITEDRPPQPVR